MIPPPSYRLPESLKLGGVRLQVADLARSIRYYEDVLGLRAWRHSGTDATLGPQNDDTPLVTLHERPGAAPVPRRGRLGLYHFAILVPTRATLGRFLRHLTERGLYAGMSDHLVSEALYLSDPDGLGIEVYADRPRAAWEYDGQQLRMATDPLDTDDLLRAGGTEPWTGMPAGTTMGHVHLHVGDLAAAADFYHGGLGFDKTVWSYPGALFLSAGGYHHHLGTNTWAAGAAPAGDADAKLLEWEIIVPTAADVAAALDHVASRGGQVVRTGDTGIAYDPWHTAVRIRT